MAETHRKILYVGGLAEEVEEAVLHAAFLPFGPLETVQIPLDQKTQKNRGFGFVQFEDREDAAAALDNMDNAELFGRVLTVNIAKPMKIKLGSHKAVWSEADEWYKNKLKDGDVDESGGGDADDDGAASGGGGGGGALPDSRGAIAKQ